MRCCRFAAGVVDELEDAAFASRAACGGRQRLVRREVPNRMGLLMCLYLCVALRVPYRQLLANALFTTLFSIPRFAAPTSLLVLWDWLLLFHALVAQPPGVLI